MKTLTMFFIYFQTSILRGVVVKTVTLLVRSVADQMSGTVCLVRALCYYMVPGKRTLLSASIPYTCSEGLLYKVCFQVCGGM